ncbi:MAG: hypothetical protein QGH59_00815 [Gemmatimonadota bacterium]|nr:hypothetical protein [Gemmatimonadota bacterium]
MIIRTVAKLKTAPTEAKIRAIHDGLPEFRKVMVARLAKRGQTIWKKNLSGPASGTKVGVKSGRLRRSIRIKEGAETSSVYTDSTPYAATHEFGSGKFSSAGIRVRARRYPYMVFFYKGQWRRKAEVHHPMRPHLLPTYDQLIGETPRIFGRKARAFLQKAGEANAK